MSGVQVTVRSDTAPATGLTLEPLTEQVLPILVAVRTTLSPLCTLKLKLLAVVAVLETAVPLIVMFAPGLLVPLIV